MTRAKPAPAPLTDDQHLIARLFGLMDDRRQNEMLRYATDIAKAFPRTGPAPRGTMNEAYNWVMAQPGSAPDSPRNVLVWDSVDCMPVTAYSEEDEKSWYGIGGGRDLTEAVTHWRDIEAPAGVAV